MVFGILADGLMQEQITSAETFRVSSKTMNIEVTQASRYPSFCFFLRLVQKLSRLHIFASLFLCDVSFFEIFNLVSLVTPF